MNPIVKVKLKSGETLKAVRLDRLQLPISLVLGHFEAATQEELYDAITDLNAEVARRQEAGPA